MCCNNTSAIPPRRRAFTFIEIMIVVVIIGLLAGAVTLSTRNYMDRAKQNRARSDIATLCNALESFYSVNGSYPSNDVGLSALVPQFIPKLVNDPWGRPYQYNQPGQNGPYDVISYGADGKEGGEGVDADIRSDQLDIQYTGKSQ